ncbi:hypothetical protein B0H14DRAFT_2601800 [Mycena olivaceomarginata]|nr:hypothetical protein B0H14DRAFT_2601800 [Mycena olivaceomarginata]
MSHRTRPAESSVVRGANQQSKAHRASWGQIAPGYGRVNLHPNSAVKAWEEAMVPPGSNIERAKAHRECWMNKDHASAGGGLGCSESQIERSRGAVRFGAAKRQGDDEETPKRGVKKRLESRGALGEPNRAQRARKATQSPETQLDIHRKYANRMARAMGKYKARKGRWRWGAKLSVKGVEKESELVGVDVEKHTVKVYGYPRRGGGVGDGVEGHRAGTPSSRSCSLSRRGRGAGEIRMTPPGDAPSTWTQARSPSSGDPKALIRR